MNLRDVPENLIMTVTEVEDSSNQIIINGVVQTQKIKVVELKCKHCGYIISRQQLNPTTSFDEIKDYIKDNISNIDINYCPHCGTKVNKEVDSILELVDNNGVYELKENIV